MADINKYLEELKETISSLSASQQSAENNDTQESELYSLYKKVKEELSILDTNYENCIDLLDSSISVIILALIDIVYVSNFKKELLDYNNISEFIKFLLNDNSELMKLITLLEEHYKIYKALTDESEKNKEKEYIEKCLKQLYELLKVLIETYHIIPSDVEIDTSSSLPYTLKSETNKSFNISDSLSYDAWSGSVDKSGWIGQESDIYILKDSAEEDSSLIVSVPVAKISNRVYNYDPNTFLLLNFRNYTAVFQEENDESDKNNTSNVMDVYSYIRCGGIFSGSTTIQNETMQFKIQYDSREDSWSSGEINYFGKFYNNKCSIQFEYNTDDVNPEEYPYTKLSDSILFTKTFSFKSSTDNSETQYTLSGTLSYDETKTLDHINEINNYVSLNDKNISFDTRNTTYYSGTLTLSNNNINLESMSYEDRAAYESNSAQLQKQVIVEIKYNDKNEDSQIAETYDVYCYLSEDYSSSSVAMNDQIETLIPFFAIQTTYTNIKMSNIITVSSDETKIVQSLLSLSSLSVDDNFESNYSILWNIIEESKETLLNTLLNKINNLNKLLENISYVKSDFSSSFNNLPDEPFNDFTSLITTMTDNFSSYLSSDSFDSEDLYDGVLYNKMNEFYSSAVLELQNIFSDACNGRNELKLLTDNLFFVLNKTKHYISISSLATKMYNIFNSNTDYSETLSSSGIVYQKYNIKSYSSWESLIKELIKVSANIDEDVLNEEFNKLPSYYLYFLYVYYVSRHILQDLDQQNSDLYKLIENQEYTFLLQFLTDNKNNYIVSSVTDSTMLSIIESYNNLEHIKKYLNNDNIFYISPGLLKNIDTTYFDYIEIEDSVSFYNYENYKSIIYSGILKNKFSALENILLEKIKYIYELKKVNFREALYIVNFLSVCKEIKEKFNNDFKSIDDTYLDVIYNVYVNEIQIYLKYKDYFKNKKFSSLFSLR